MHLRRSGRRRRRKTGDDSDYVSAIAQSPVREVPGYSGCYHIIDEDTPEKMRIMRKDAEAAPSEDKKSVYLCQRMDSKIAEAEKDNISDRRTRTADKKRVTLANVIAYNLELVTGRESNKDAFRKYMRHEHLYKMMQDGVISKGKGL